MPILPDALIVKPDPTTREPAKHPVHERQLIDVISCNRCHGMHHNVNVIPFGQPNGPATHWAPCPVRGEPIIVYIDSTMLEVLKHAPDTFCLVYEGDLDEMMIWRKIGNKLKDFIKIGASAEKV